MCVRRAFKSVGCVKSRWPRLLSTTSVESCEIGNILEMIVVSITQKEHASDSMLGMHLLSIHLLQYYIQLVASPFLAAVPLRSIIKSIYVVGVSVI